jgi:hypothetical protein
MNKIEPMRIGRPIYARIDVRDAAQFVAATLLAATSGVEVARVWHVRVSEAGDVVSAALVVWLFVSSVAVASRIHDRAAVCASALLLVAQGGTLLLGHAPIGALYIAVAALAMALTRANVAAWSARLVALAASPSPRATRA